MRAGFASASRLICVILISLRLLSFVERPHPLPLPREGRGDKDKLDGHVVSETRSSAHANTPVLAPPSPVGKGLGG